VARRSGIAGTAAASATSAAASSSTVTARLAATDTRVTCVRVRLRGAQQLLGVLTGLSPFVAIHRELLRRRIRVAGARRDDTAARQNRGRNELP